MKQVENNAFFWQKLDTLYVSSTIEISVKKNEPHSEYSHLIYPVDFGVANDIEGKGNIKVFRGSLDEHEVQAIAISIDILRRDTDIKLIVGCSEEEIYKIMQFLNETEFQKSILVHRSDDISPWAVFD